MIERIYVAATSQHIGKTTSTLGLVHALRKKDINVGYCKPVGQQFLDLENHQVDKDAFLFSGVMDFELVSDIHSPVILGKGATVNYLDDPSQQKYPEKIRKAKEVLEDNYELVVYEGTGHPGVGSVCDLSNADVAELIGAKVILVVEGGIGNTIDKINLSLSLFRSKDIPILGIIVNKVRPEKLDKVKKYIKMYLDKQNLPLLGVIPYDKTMAYPLLHTVKSAVYGEVMANAHNLNNQVANTIDSSLMELEELTNYEHLMLIISSRKLAGALKKMKEFEAKNNFEKSPLSGIILTYHKFIDEESRQYIDEREIPVIHTQMDTYGAVMKISRIEVKINPRTPWKIHRAEELISEHVNLDLL
ncbi:MAG: AAA family ATPase [Psychroflexus sp.]|nr:AAA family ATPase [Psychroflexus sp.]MDR9448013.1 AAA family ATPase [Psychroflexus sp.]